MSDEPTRRDDLDPLTRAVSDALDELLFRHHGISTSWANPESFIKWLGERCYIITAADMSAEPEASASEVSASDEETA